MASKQLGFYFDESRCVQCRTCETACKSARDVEPGVQLIRVTEKWAGQYPEVSVIFSAKMCLHCAKPACVQSCPTGAIVKRAEDGIVIVDAGKCNGCRECLQACPFDVPQFGRDGKMQICDICASTGREPACAVSCPAEALVVGDLEELLTIARDKRKSVHKIEGAGGPSIIVVN